MGADGASLTTVWRELPSVYVQTATRTRLTVRAAAQGEGTRLEIQAEIQRNEGDYDPLIPDNIEWKFLARDEELEQSILERLRARLQAPQAPRMPGESRPELRPR